ncbi:MULTISPECIES: hypothetical protein [unclassified Solwaraspora]|uniref:hypothetical protein n=1 Tax=unclassified Solwaraspora TaxID=2627926 RepID=UPI00338E75E3
MIIPLGHKLSDQLVDMLSSVLQEKVEALFPSLRIATTHQPHRLAKSSRHALKTIAYRLSERAAHSWQTSTQEAFVPVGDEDTTPGTPTTRPPA